MLSALRVAAEEEEAAYETAATSAEEVDVASDDDDDNGKYGDTPKAVHGCATGRSAAKGSPEEDDER